VADSLTTSGSCGALRTRAAAVDHAGGPLELKDEAADARRNPVSTQPESVLSGRTIAGMRRGHPA